MILLPPRSTRTDTLFPYTTLFRARLKGSGVAVGRFRGAIDRMLAKVPRNVTGIMKDWGARTGAYFMFITLFLNNFYPLPPGRTACRRWCGWASAPAARSRIPPRRIAATPDRRRDVEGKRVSYQ